MYIAYGNGKRMHIDTTSQIQKARVVKVFMAPYLLHLISFCCLFTRSQGEVHSECKSNTCCELWDEVKQKCAVCSPGYIGVNCSEVCPFPNYGRECQGECRCDERLCDIATGCYSPDDGCRSGYFGDRCMNRCKYPNYGKACQVLCECAEEYCNFINGCNIPESTRLMILPTNAQNLIITPGSSEGVSVGVVFAVTAVPSVSLSIIITLIIWRIKRQRTSSTNSPGNNCTTACHSAQPNCFVNDARPSRYYSTDVLVSTIRHEREDDPYLTLQRESTASNAVTYSEYDEVKDIEVPNKKT